MLMQSNVIKVVKVLRNFSSKKTYTAYLKSVFFEKSLRADEDVAGGVGRPCPACLRRAIATLSGSECRSGNSMSVGRARAFCETPPAAG